MRHGIAWRMVWYGMGWHARLATPLRNTPPTCPKCSLSQFEDPPLHDPCAVAYVIAPQLFKASSSADSCCASQHAGFLLTPAPAAQLGMCGYQTPLLSQRHAAFFSPPDALGVATTRRRSCCAWMWRPAPPCPRVKPWWTSGTSPPAPRTARSAWCDLNWGHRAWFAGLAQEAHGQQAALSMAGHGHKQPVQLCERQLSGTETVESNPPFLQEMDVARFWDLQIEAIHAADRCSQLNGGAAQ